MGKFISLFIFSFFLLGIFSAARADDSEQVRGWFLQVQTDSDTQSKKSLNKKERQQLFDYVVHHKVAAITQENDAKYDPTGEIGYCYGRAMAVHLRARRMGLHPDAVKKLFIVGDLRQGPKPEWRFHVTTLVKGTEDNAWYAVDPILLKPQFKGSPVLMTEWIRTIRSVWDKKGKAFLYRVGPVTVVPDIRIFPDSGNESGDRLIEIKFKPSTKEGFTPITEGGIALFDVSAKAQEQYFLMGKESVDADQFNFSELNIDQLIGNDVKKKHYSYNGYFLDLVDDIRKSTYARNIQERRLGGTDPGGTEIHGTEIHGTEIHGTEIHKGGPNLHSFRFFGARP